MRGSAELEARVRDVVAKAKGPTFNVDGHAKMLASIHNNHSVDVIRRLIVYELKSRRDLSLI